MKSLGFRQDILIRFKFKKGVSLDAAEKALLKKAYHSKSALQLAADISSVWRFDMGKFLKKSLCSVRKDWFSGTLVLRLETHVMASEEFIGFIMDMLQVMIQPPQDTGPLPETFMPLWIELDAYAIQPHWFSVLVGEEDEGSLFKSFTPKGK